MASKGNKKDKADNTVSLRINKKAIGKPCDICGLFITESEADEHNIIHVSTKRGTDIFIHMDCWRKGHGKSK